MSVWDALTWVTVLVLGPGVLVIALAVARDVRRLLGRPAASAEEAAAPAVKEPGAPSAKKPGAPPAGKPVPRD